MRWISRISEGLMDIRNPRCRVGLPPRPRVSPLPPGGRRQPRRMINALEKKLFAFSTSSLPACSCLNLRA